MHVISAPEGAAVLPSRGGCGCQATASLTMRDFIYFFWVLSYLEVQPPNVDPGFRQRFVHRHRCSQSGKRVVELHQFVQQGTNAVVLRGAGDGLVAHGADASHLQPLDKTPADRQREDQSPHRPLGGPCVWYRGLGKAVTWYQVFRALVSGFQGSPYCNVLF